ncbi:MAG: hypothetical protein ACKVP0_03950 [Pirellulaceae bacterium]
MTIESDEPRQLRESGNSPGAVARPPFQLRSLPAHLRWEVTRRHPYYQTLWQVARAYHRNEPILEAIDQSIRELAVHFLGAIGVQGEPPDPATGFDQLGGGSWSSSWLSGAVHPISMKGLAGILLAHLPKEALGHLGLIFAGASCDDQPNRPPRQAQAFAELGRLTCPGLEAVSSEPFVSVNPAASEREINKSLDGLIKQWKQDRGLREQRVQPEKFEEYLDVWDRREGWRNGAYDRSQELTLIDIAKHVQRSVQTVNQQYKNAFALITGNAYSPELFRILFGPLKYSDFDLRPPGTVSLKRPLKTRKRKPVSESRLHDSVDLVTNRAGASEVSSDDDVADYFAEIEIRIGKGHSDQRIVEDLDLPKNFVEAVASVRGRLADGLFNSTRHANSARIKP